MTYTDVLKKVEHFLTSIDGLYVSDKEDFTDAFRLNCSELLDELDQEYWDECDYIEILINQYHKKNDYMIEYGSNHRFRADKDLPVIFKDFYVIFLDETNNPFKIINMDSIISIHKC